MLPENFLAALLLSGHDSAGDEQKIGKTIQEGEAGLAYMLMLNQGNRGSFSAAAHRSRQMPMGGGGTASRKDEFAQGWQRAVKMIQPGFKPHDMLQRDAFPAGDAQIPAQVKEQVLYLAQTLSQLFWG